MFERAVWLVPAADPAARAWVNFPVAYTRLPTTTCAHATPSIWTVGRASALTVVCVTGGTGAVSASAGPDCSNGTASASVTVATKLPATRRRRFFTCVSIMLPLEGLEDSTPPRASRHRTVGRAVTARQALLGKRSSLVTLRRNATRRTGRNAHGRREARRRVTDVRSGRRGCGRRCWTTRRHVRENGRRPARGTRTCPTPMPRP